MQMSDPGKGPLWKAPTTDGARHPLRDGAEDDDFCSALLAGLAATPKQVSCKFFYDAEGSALFDRICTLPEYYPTRVEFDLLERHTAELAGLIGPDVELVEFGAGSGRKVRRLLDALQRPRAYVPVDISGEHLRQAASRLSADYPRLDVRPIVADYTHAFDLPPSISAVRRRVGFFPGSTIGNFAPEEATGFLAMAAALLDGGGLLIGVDLVKDPALLHAAYNDSQGVTAAFNKNLLARANRELGADFAEDGFAHYAFYQPLARRVEMHLVSLAAQRVRVAGREFRFAAGETLHTENSYKYTIDGFRSLAEQAGFVPRRYWTDAARLFSLHWLEVA
ncbi:L-histidine N(alpha)-methyltransferase [Aromatoleum buckelii]|uniref:L-histidine N(Alpha)-methyltransferase n=1 Tax=Aromatoleum buckelii TaxID=200254 RepID=A0ABX1MZ98_9RHOO|nr:L-histidine N(alpha)-methyltransferase [Aromatoleum buckelii]MCK0512593.1 L-histidine N(alpha)-methyltransferase [Aromatoleum buckelii]